MQTERYDKNEELYKKYRNYIVELSKEGYVSATRARKGLAGDACAIMRIHAFLEHWGIINYACKNQMIHHPRRLITKFSTDGKTDLFEYDKTLTTKHYGHDDTEILKRATRKYRPLCDFCGHRCGVLWFQHKKIINSKEVSRIMKNVNPKNQPISSSDYEIILCIKCYSEGNFPVILSPNDFTKTSIQDRLNDAKFKKRREREAADPSAVTAEWSVEDISLLLDLVAKHGDNWEDISAHFRGRSEEDVVQCFLNLPLKQISKIKFEVERDDFIKSNSLNLVNDDTSHICQHAINKIHEQVAVLHINGHIDNRQERDNNNHDIIANGEIKENGMELEADHSPAHQVPAHSSPQQAERPTALALQIKNKQAQAAAEERKLFDELMQLYLKKVELKLRQLEQWEGSVVSAKKEIQESRKYVLAEKIRNLVK